MLASFKFFYLLYFASASCLQPFLPLIFRRAGLSEQHVGTIAALRPWVGLPCGALLSGIADKWRIHRSILTACFCLSVCIRLSISIATTFPAILSIILITDAINSPTNIIVDAAAIAACASSTNTNGESEAYGRQRLYGAIGWGTFSLISGSAQTAFHGSSTVAFILFGVLAVATVVPTLKIPWEPLHAKLQEEHLHSEDDAEDGQGKEREERENGGSGSGERNSIDGTSYAQRQGGLVNRSRETSPLRHAFDGGRTTSSPYKTQKQQKSPPPPPPKIKNKNFSQKLGLLLSSPEALLFFATVTVMGYAVGTIESFLFLFLEDLGGSETLMGLTLTVTCIAETLIFYYASNIMQYFGLDGCFHLCFIAFLVRLGSYATLSHWKTPWAVLPVELLHGITFGLTWSAGTAKSALIAPAGLEATTQSAFQGFMFGLGYGTGGFMAGRKYNLNGPEAVFRSAFFVVAVGWGVTSGAGWVLRKYGWIQNRRLDRDLDRDGVGNQVVYSEVEMSDGGAVGAAAIGHHC
jgi:MFS family permease